MRIAVLGKTFDEQFTGTINFILDKLEENNINIIIEKKYYQYLKSLPDCNPPEMAETFEDRSSLKDVDFLFCMGGDGTFLQAVSLVRDYGIPILGINTGRLGFLTDVSREDAETALEDFLLGNYTIEDRSLIQLENSENGAFNGFKYALNEFTITKKDTSSMIIIHAYIDGEFLTSYWADGLIISTPTGSTAYNLSVGGPIVYPQVKTMLISPIAPHNLSVRPLLIPDNCKIKLTVDSREDHFRASLDSRSEVLHKSQAVELSKASFTVKTLKPGKGSFYSTLRHKLMWGADRRN